MRQKAQTEGCITGWRRNYLARSGRALPYVSQRAVLASSPQALRRPAVPGFAARVPYIVGRAFTPAGEEVAAMGTGWALCSALPRSARRFRKAPRRARLPALHCGRKRAATRKRQSASTPDDGPMQASAPTQGRAAAGRMRQSGRILPPCFAGCAAAGKGICKARCGTPPSPAATPPLTGEAFEAAAAPKGSPARGAGCAGGRRRRGALPAGGGNIPQGPAGPCPRVSQGVRRPGGRGGPEGYLQDQVRHPSVACGDTSPYRRGFRGRQRTKRRPCKGSLSSSSLLKAASPVKGRRWRRLPYPSTVTSVRRTWPASQASRSRMQGAGRLPAVRSTRP